MLKIDDYDFTKFDPNKKYHLHLDTDTILFACAVVVDNDPCTVKHNRSGRKKTFDSFSAFIDFLDKDEKGKEFTVKDFDVPCIGYAFSNFNNKLKEVVNQKWVSDYTLHLSGDGNFRKDIYPEYKANRKKSPAMRKFLHDYVCWKYKDRVVLSHGAEAEDFCLAATLKDKENSVIGACDKDVTTQSCLFFNYQKMEKGVFFINKTQAFYNLCCQLLHGDRACDNIMGITKVTPELKKKYNLKTSSIGEKTAERLLDDVKDCKLKMKKRIVDIYQLTYNSKWGEELQFTGSLVFISKEPNKYFDINIFLRGIECDE